MAETVDEIGTHRARRIVCEVRRGPLARPVLSRAVGVAAARADLPVDRLSDALLVIDALGAAEGLPTHVLRVVLEAADGLTVRLGPLPAGSASRLIEEASLPAAPHLIERLADDVHVSRDGRGEYVVVKLAASENGAGG